MRAMTHGELNRKTAYLIDMDSAPAPHDENAAIGRPRDALRRVLRREHELVLAREAQGCASIAVEHRPADIDVRIAQERQSLA